MPSHESRCKAVAGLKVESGVDHGSDSDHKKVTMMRKKLTLTLIEWLIRLPTERKAAIDSSNIICQKTYDTCYGFYNHMKTMREISLVFKLKGGKAEESGMYVGTMLVKMDMDSSLNHLSQEVSEGSH